MDIYGWIGRAVRSTAEGEPIRSGYGDGRHAMRCATDAREIPDLSQRDHSYRRGEP